MKQTTLNVLAIGLVAGLAQLAGAATPLNAVITVDDPAGQTGEPRVRVVHASPDAPAVDILVDDSPAFTSVPFEGTTDFASLAAGTYNVKVVPAGATSPVVIEADLELMANTDYTVIASDTLDMITPIILTADGSTPAAGNAWVRFFHGSPDAPAVDIAVTDGPVLFSNVAFQESTAYLPVAAGTYDLEARVAGTMDVALSLPGVALQDGAVYTVYATGLLADVGVLDELHFIPAAARAPGADDSYWTTDVDVNNSDDRPVSFQYLWLPRDADNAMPTASETFVLQPGETIRHSDVLNAAFGVSDGTDAFGALAVLADSAELKIFSRTFNRGADGTYGQAIPGIPASELIPANQKKRILFFTENDDFRSNIGVLNGTGSPITVSWERYTADGKMVDAPSAELPAWGNTQLNQVFSAEAPVAGAYIDVWTSTDGGAFTAYGSVVSNGTSDPTTVLPQ